MCPVQCIMPTFYCGQHLGMKKVSVVAVSPTHLQTLVSEHLLWSPLSEREPTLVILVVRSGSMSPLFHASWENAFRWQHLVSPALDAQGASSRKHYNCRNNYQTLQSLMITLPSLVQRATEAWWLLSNASRSPTCARLLVSGSNVTNTELQVLSFIIPKKLSPGGSHGTGLQWQVFCPIKQVNSAMLLVDI